MSRLPAGLAPLWPLVKRSHRRATKVSGTIVRASHLGGSRAVPRSGTSSIEETIAAEPDAVRVHRGAPARTVLRRAPVGHPAPLRVFEDDLRTEVPGRYVLEVTDGRLIGDYAATVTPGGLLEGETSQYFGTRGWDEHPIYLRPRLPVAEHLEGTTLSLVSHGTRFNYFHLLTDLATRWGVAREILPDLRPDHVVVNTTFPAHRELLAVLGIDAFGLVEATKHLAVRADTLLVPGLTGFGPVAAPWITRWLQENLPAKRSAGLPRRLYLTRGDRRNTRRLVNEAAVVTRLEKLGFTLFNPGAHTLQEQIDHFAAAEVVVSPHGAALTNLNFCRPGVRVLELFAPTYVNTAFWGITQNIENSRYRYLVAEPVDPARSWPQMNGLMTDIDLSVDDVLDAVDDLLAEAAPAGQTARTGIPVSTAVSEPWNPTSRFS